MEAVKEHSAGNSTPSSFIFLLHTDYIYFIFIGFEWHLAVKGRGVVRMSDNCDFVILFIIVMGWVIS